MNELSKIFSVLLAGVVALAAPCFLQGQLISCSTPGSTDEYKIYVDDVRLPAAGVSLRLRKRADFLRNAFLADLNNTLQDRAAVKRCNGRFPLDKSDFTDTQVDSLSNLRVVLEVWTAIEDQATAAGEFGFVLVPARSIAPPAVFVVKDNFQRDVNSILKRNKQLQAFAPVVLGTRYYQNQKYLEALPLLCQGHTQLQAVIAAPQDAQLLQREKDLLGRLDDIIDDSYRKAKASGEPQFAALTPDGTHRYNCPK
jgi:hypothetical protein